MMRRLITTAVNDRSSKRKKNLVQPTHLMHGAEYDEMVEAIDAYKDKFESVAIAEPMLGEVGDDATVINDDSCCCSKEPQMKL